MENQKNADQVQQDAQESALQTSQPDVPIEAPESVLVAEGSTDQPEQVVQETTQTTEVSEEHLAADGEAVTGGVEEAPNEEE